MQHSTHMNPFQNLIMVHSKEKVGKTTRCRANKRHLDFELLLPLLWLVQSAVRTSHASTQVVRIYHINLSGKFLASPFTSYPSQPSGYFWNSTVQSSIGNANIYMSCFQMLAQYVHRRQMQSKILRQNPIKVKTFKE